jgi:phosphatidylinositol-3-phosphatase
MRTTRLWLVVALAMVVTACSGSRPSASTQPSESARPTATATASRTPSPAPPGTRSPHAARQVRLDAAHPCGIAPSGTHDWHVIWIWMENKPYGSVIGNKSAPYENTLAGQCGLATDYHGITHPSLPNYLAATGGSTFGVHDDSAPSSHPIDADSIFGQLDRAALTWRSYEESMPTNCATSASSPYAVKHNPAAYFTPLRASCEAHDVPLAGNLDRDIAAGALPSFSFVTPNLCSDTHDCSVHTGDTWLATWIPKILGGPNYRAGNTLVVLTWDEGVGSGNQIPTIVVAPSVRPGTTVGARLDHYALLRGTEDVLGLSHLAAAASAPSLAVAFGL